MVATTHSRSRAAQMAEGTQTTFAPIPSPKKQTTKPKGAETPKTDGSRSRPRTRGPPRAKPRSASTRTPPRKAKTNSVGTEKRTESKSASRKKTTHPTKKDGSINGKSEDVNESATKNNVKTKSRRQSKAGALKKEPVTKKKVVKVKPAKKPPTQKRPRGQSQQKQVQKNTATKKPKLEVNNPKAKIPPREKPAERAKRSVSQLPPKKSWATEASEPENEPIAMRTRSHSGIVAPPVKKAPPPRASRTRAKKAQPVRAVEVSISVEEPTTAGTHQNESEATGKDAKASPNSPTPEEIQGILPNNEDEKCSSNDSATVNNAPEKSNEPLNQHEQIFAAEGSNCNAGLYCYNQMKRVKQYIKVSTCSNSAKSIPETNAQRRALSKPTPDKFSTLSTPSSEDTFEVPFERGPVLNDAIDSIVSAIHQHKDIGYPGKTLAGICFSILAQAGISALRRGDSEDTGAEVSKSAASVCSSIKTAPLGQIDSSEPGMTPVPAVGALLDDSLGLELDHVEPEEFSFSLHFHVEKKKQGTQRKSYTFLRFTKEQQDQLAAIFRGCFNPRE